MLTHVLLILGVIALTMALRSYQHPVLHKLGAVAILGTSFLFGWLLTGSWGVGLFCAALWFLLPWFDLLTRIRRLSLPVERHLRHKAPPTARHFPDLAELSDEMEGEGFEHVADAGWDWEEHQQFFRLFGKADERLQSAICLIEQPEGAFSYLSISSRAQDGTIWTTWNYPFSYSLQLVPAWRVNRHPDGESFLQLLEGHRHFLREHGVALEALAPLDAASMQEEIQNDLRAQIAHNLASGVLTKNEAGEVRYSWRGLVYLWFQFLRDLVRLS